MVVMFSLVFTITERSEMGVYDVPVFISLLGFDIGMMFANSHVYMIMFIFRAMLYMLVRNASPSGPMWFRCLLFTLSGPVELLFLLCFIGIGLYGFSMALIIDCLHNLGTLFSVKHLLSISGSHLWEVGPRLFSCFNSSSSMPAAFRFLSATIPFLYSSAEKWYTSVTSPVASVGSIEGLGLLDMVPRPLMSSWCASWLELSRHRGVEMLGSLERLLIVFQAFRL